jgi:hypothetical protein
VVALRGHDRRHWGGTINDRWLWTFPILFPVACVVLFPVAIVYSLWTLVKHMKTLWHILLVAFIYLHCGQLRADDTVDALLITGLDVSSSINAQETMLQIEGVAAAIRSPAVVSAIQNGTHRRIGFQVFVWADGDYPELLPWTVIASQDDADKAAEAILAHMQALIDASSRTVGTLTDLSAAMDHAGRLMNTAPWFAERALVNMVGNGEDNVGEDPPAVRDALVASSITVNGVVVGGDPAVMAYYRDNVKGGKHAFVLPAGSAEDMAGAMIAKFVTEIAMAY